MYIHKGHSTQHHRQKVVFGSGSSIHVNYEVIKIHQHSLDNICYLEKLHLEYVYFDGYRGILSCATCQKAHGTVLNVKRNLNNPLTKKEISLLAYYAYKDLNYHY